MSAATVRAATTNAAAVLAGGELRYSAVWEDHLLLERGLRIGTHSRVLAIASAGDNVLNLLRLAPRRIVAIDVNPAQTAMLALKLAALATLDHGGFLSLLGVREHGDRLALYERVRPRLGATARDWWDANAPTLARGAEGEGRLDRFIGEFRRSHLQSSDARAALAALFDASTLEAQRRASERLLTPAVEAAFRMHFSREALGGRGRDATQFAFVDDTDVGGWFLGRLRCACTTMPARGNHYLERFLLGAPLDAESGPPYLRRDQFARLGALAPRVELVTDTLDAWLDSRAAGDVDAAALSDVFEYLSPAESDALFARLARVLPPRGRVAYWNLLVPRRSPESLPALRHLGALSQALWRRDRSWFYRSFNVEEVTA